MQSERTTVYKREVYEESTGQDPLHHSSYSKVDRSPLRGIDSPTKSRTHIVGYGYPLDNDRRYDNEIIDRTTTRITTTSHNEGHTSPYEKRYEGTYSKSPVRKHLTDERVRTPVKHESYRYETRPSPSQASPYTRRIPEAHSPYERREESASYRYKDGGFSNRIDNDIERVTRRIPEAHSPYERREEIASYRYKDGGFSNRLDDDIERDIDRDIERVKRRIEEIKRSDILEDGVRTPVRSSPAKEFERTLDSQGRRIGRSTVYSTPSYNDRSPVKKVTETIYYD